MAITTGAGTVRAWLAGAFESLRPPPVLSLSDWADEHFRLSAESAAEPGRWTTLPYQRGIMDAITDPAVERVTVMKGARIGYTKAINAAIAYYIVQDPCPILVVQPTVEDAKGYSKEEIAPMLRDVDVLRGLVKEASSRSSSNTMVHKRFPGGLLSMIGANSGTGFRRVSRRIVIFDEVDGYPPSAGAEGDPIKLGEKRSEYYWNRKIIAGSTPLIAGASRIEELFESGDRRRYYVPCPECGHADFLSFRRDADRGHVMRWPDGRPELAYFVCSGKQCEIQEQSKQAMVAAGEWRADGEFAGHASFHIWAAYSSSPNATWGKIASEFIEAKHGGSEKLKTFVNTVLGETWRERGEAPEWEQLYQRREDYPLGTVPTGAIVVTAGVDVQKDRLVYEVVGWGANKESWSIDAGELHGDTALDATWLQLDALLGRAYVGADGERTPITMLAVDSGYNTQVVYGWARQHPISRVIAVKGLPGARMLVGSASPVDVTIRGRRLQRGYKVWPVGVDVAKSELYGWLRLVIGADGVAPPGYCHFPEHDTEFFRQLTAEHLVTSVNRRTNRARLEWQVIPNRQNHYLDARVYARAAAAVLGIDRLAREPRISDAAPPPTPAPRQTSAPPPSGRGFWGRRARVPGKGWIR
jgi:phage terminase large subunit GpA-like protein